jgi:hypothetical protein
MPLAAVGALAISVVFDWPRALAGAVIGFVMKWVPLRVHPLVVGAIGVPVAAALGEFLYPWLYTGYQPSWYGFLGGLFVSGVCAIGLWRVFAGILTSQ